MNKEEAIDKVKSYLTVLNINRSEQTIIYELLIDLSKNFNLHIDLENLKILDE